MSLTVALVITILALLVILAILFFDDLDQRSARKRAEARNHHFAEEWSWPIRRHP
jgi:hypothetical protein